MLTDNTNTDQAQGQDLTAEEAKASLGMATFLQQQIMPKADPMATDGSQDPNSALGQEQPQRTQEPAPQEQQAPQMADFEVMLKTHLDEMRKELKADNQRELDQLKEQISNALKEDGQEN